MIIREMSYIICNIMISYKPVKERNEDNKNMKMKKLIAIMLSMALAASVAACGIDALDGPDAAQSCRQYGSGG